VALLAVRYGFKGSADGVLAGSREVVAAVRAFLTSISSLQKSKLSARIGASNWESTRKKTPQSEIR